MKNWMYIAVILFVACSPKAISLNKNAEEFNKIINNKGTQIIDVRTPEEFNAGHIEGAINFNIYDAQFEENLKGLNKSKPVALYCKSGGRSSNAVVTFQKLEFKKIYELDGGFDSWKKNGLKSIKSTKKKVEHPEDKLTFEEIIASDRLTVVDFYADWCRPCKMMAPYIHALKEEMADEIYVRKINSDIRQDLGGKYKIEGLPTLVLFKNSKEIHRVVGYRDEAALRTMINQWK